MIIASGATMTKNTSKIHFIAKNPDCAYSRYRHTNIIEALALSKKYTASISSTYDPSVDIVVFGRQSLGIRNLRSLVKTAKTDHKIIVFDIDDNLLFFRNIPYFIKHDRKSPIFWFLYISRIRFLLKSCDATTSTNQFLSDKLYKVSHKSSLVIPNFLNRAQIEASKNPQKPNGFTLGYFSGSATHDEDLALISAPLANFLHDHSDAKLILTEGTAIPENLAQFSTRIVKKPLVDYIALQEYYASVSVNLAPLVVNDFTNCKSELKFFESAIAETTTLASPTYAFQHSIVDGKTGFLCKTKNDWYIQLEYLYSRPEENVKIAKAAKKYCLEHYYGAEILKTIEDVYDTVSKQNQK